MLGISFTLLDLLPTANYCDITTTQTTLDYVLGIRGLKVVLGHLVPAVKSFIYMTFSHLYTLKYENIKKLLSSSSFIIVACMYYSC